MSEERDSRSEAPEPEDLEVESKEAEDVKGGHEIVSPRDPASGQATGKRNQIDISIAKLND